MKKIVVASLVIVSCFTFSQPKNKAEFNLFSTKDRAVVVYTTAENSSLRLSKTDNLEFKELKQPTEKQVCVFVNPLKNFQAFLGIGGAISEASAEVFAKLSKEKQQELRNAYYSTDKGIAYPLMRTNRNSCDFSSDRYTYIKEGDKSLKTFNIGHDRKYRIPIIKRATATAGGKMTLYVSTMVSRDSLLSTSFINSNGKMVTVVMNQTKEKVVCNLCIGTQATEVSILPNAMQTLVY